MWSRLVAAMPFVTGENASKNTLLEQYVTGLQGYRVTHQVIEYNYYK